MISGTEVGDDEVISFARNKNRCIYRNVGWICKMLVGLNKQRGHYLVASNKLRTIVYHVRSKEHS